MSDTTPPVDQPEGVAPVAPARKSQAAYDAARKETKAKAADTIKSNDKKAQAAKKKAQAQGATIEGLQEFNDRAREIELKINSKSSDDE